LTGALRQKSSIRSRSRKAADERWPCSCAHRLEGWEESRPFGRHLRVAGCGRSPQTLFLRPSGKCPSFFLTEIGILSRWRCLPPPLLLPPPPIHSFFVMATRLCVKRRND
jgi:hypothetical protein